MPKHSSGGGKHAKASGRAAGRGKPAPRPAKDKTQEEDRSFWGKAAKPAKTNHQKGFW